MTADEAELVALRRKQELSIMPVGIFLKNAIRRRKDVKMKKKMAQEYLTRLTVGRFCRTAMGSAKMTVQKHGGIYEVSKTVSS